jgi:hypothetical protein
MRIILFFLLIFFNIYYSQSQNDPKSIDNSKLSKFTAKWSPKHVLIDAWIFEKDGTKKFGHLYEVTDSAISLIPQIELRRENRDLMIINYSKINTIALREDNRKSKMFRKFLPLALLTGLVGGTAFFYMIDGKSKVNIFGLGFISGTGIGLIAGAIVGSIKVAIPIKGKYNNFEKHSNELKSIAVQQ